MISESIIFFGIFTGLLHAFEPDHLAAVSSYIDVKDGRLKDLTYRGAIWGIGHGLMMTLLCFAALGLNFAISQNVENSLEAGVGVLLILLGSLAIARYMVASGKIKSLSRLQILNASDNLKAQYKQVFMVGVLHGAAGTAAVIAVYLSNLNSFSDALTLLILFSIGAVLGMAATTLVAGTSLRFMSQYILTTRKYFSLFAGSLCIFIGTWKTSALLGI